MVFAAFIKNVVGSCLTSKIQRRRMIYPGMLDWHQQRFQFVVRKRNCFSTLKIPIPPDGSSVVPMLEVLGPGGPQLSTRILQRNGPLRRVSTQRQSSRAIGVLEVSHISKLFMPFDYQSLVMFSEEVFTFLLGRRMEIVFLHHARQAVRSRFAC